MVKSRTHLIVGSLLLLLGGLLSSGLLGGGLLLLSLLGINSGRSSLLGSASGLVGGLESLDARVD